MLSSAEGFPDYWCGITEDEQIIGLRGRSYVIHMFSDVVKGDIRVLPVHRSAAVLSEYGCDWRLEWDGGQFTRFKQNFKAPKLRKLPKVGDKLIPIKRKTPTHRVSKVGKTRVYMHRLEGEYTKQERELPLSLLDCMFTIK